MQKKVPSLLVAAGEGLGYIAIMGSIKALSFDEIIPGNSVRVTSDNMIYAVDLTMVITGKPRDQAGLTLRNLSEESFPSIKFIERPTGGRGNGKTKLVSFNDALELIMVLPGKMAKEMRVKFADIIKRYLAGDASLVKEVQANAASSHPIAQMARESLAADVSPEDKALENRKRKLDMDRIELQIHHERLQLIKSLSPNGVVDDQVRMVFKDSILNAVRNDSGQALSAPDPSMQPLCLSSVATELGLRFSSDNLKAIGKKVKAAYVAAYGAPPGKHEQFVEGAPRMINLYTKRDKPMVEKAMREFQAQRCEGGHGRTLVQLWKL